MNITNLFSTFVRRLRSGARQDPVRDWLILLTLSIFALICVVVWNIWTFDAVAQGGVIGDSTSTSLPAFDRSTLDTIHNIFQTRATEESKYVTGVYHYTDPSQ
jgi:hypothetical protein